jgi:hypothetical protein
MIVLARNDDGTPKITGSVATLSCDQCGASKDIDLNVDASYAIDPKGVPFAIRVACSTLDGGDELCNWVTCWPLENGTDDAKAIVAAKTA